MQNYILQIITEHKNLTTSLSIFHRIEYPPSPPADHSNKCETTKNNNNNNNKSKKNEHTHCLTFTP